MVGECCQEEWKTKAWRGLAKFFMLGSYLQDTSVGFFPQEKVLLPDPGPSSFKFNQGGAELGVEDGQDARRTMLDVPQFQEPPHQPLSKAASVSSSAKTSSGRATLLTRDSDNYSRIGRPHLPQPEDVPLHTSVLITSSASSQDSAQRQEGAKRTRTWRSLQVTVQLMFLHLAQLGLFLLASGAKNIRSSPPPSPQSWSKSSTGSCSRPSYL